MKTNWASKLTLLVVVITFIVFVVQVFRTWTFVHLGDSPLKAFARAQEETRHFIVNPWIAIPYVMFLLAASWYALRAGDAKSNLKNRNWTLAALVASLATILASVFGGWPGR